MDHIVSGEAAAAEQNREDGRGRTQTCGSANGGHVKNQLIADPLKD